jgi:hypothetical protein
MIAKDRSCLVCGKPWTRSGFICPACLVGRYRTMHRRWLDLDYWRSVQAEEAAALPATITNASEARFALKEKGRRSA